MEEIKTISDVIQASGIIGLFVWFIIGLMKGWWVMKSSHDELKERIQELKQDRDEWKSTALRGTDIAERSVGTAASAIGQRRLESRMLSIEAQLQMGDDTT